MGEVSRVSISEEVQIETMNGNTESLFGNLELDIVDDAEEEDDADPFFCGMDFPTCWAPEPTIGYSADPHVRSSAPRHASADSVLDQQTTADRWRNRILRFVVMGSDEQNLRVIERLQSQSSTAGLGRGRGAAKAAGPVPRRRANSVQSHVSRCTRRSIVSNKRHVLIFNDAPQRNLDSPRASSDFESYIEPSSGCFLVLEESRLHLAERWINRLLGIKPDLAIVLLVVPENSAFCLADLRFALEGRIDAALGSALDDLVSWSFTSDYEGLDESEMAMDSMLVYVENAVQKKPAWFGSDNAPPQPAPRRKNSVSSKVTPSARKKRSSSTIPPPSPGSFLFGGLFS